MSLRKATADRNQEFVDAFSANDSFGMMMLLCELYEQEWRMWLLGSPDSVYKDELPEFRKQYLALRQKIKAGCDQYDISFEDVYRQRDEITMLNAQKGVPFFDDEGFPIGGFPDALEV
jgi:hypothetical protein